MTYNWGVESYDLGSAHDHIASGVDNSAAACERIRQAGGKVIRETEPVKGGITIIAFIEDPDGYKIELIENKHAAQGVGNSAASERPGPAGSGRYSAQRGHNSPCKPR